MKISENKKPNKYAVLVTYLIALICLLLGLFLPLFGGKEILALQLPGALNAVAGSPVLSFGKPFSLAGVCVISFSPNGFSLDIAAVLVLLYALVTLLGLLALIPIGISVKKGTRTACVFAYIIETAAVLVLTVYIICILEALMLYSHMATVADFGLNMLIAFGGSLLMLLLLTLMDKKATGAANIFLGLFGAVALFMLFDIVTIIPALSQPLASLDKSGISPLFYGYNAGIYTLYMLFSGDIFDAAQGVNGIWDIITMYASLIVALYVIINFLADVTGLTQKASKGNLIKRILRYSAALLFAIVLMVAVLVSKQHIGILLIVAMLMLFLQLAMSVVRLLMYKKRMNALAEDAYEKEHMVRFEKPVKKVVTITEPKQLAIIDGMPEPATAEPEEEIVPVKENGSVQLEITETPQPEPRALEPEIISIEDIEAPEDDEETEEAEEPVEEIKPVETVAAVEEVKPALEETEPEPVTVEEVQPVETVTVEEAEPEQPVEETKPVETVPPTPVAEQQIPETQIYTINRIYGGPLDDFMRKLTNEERIEFAQTFIEMRKGVIGNIPEYIIGGENKKFFSSVFIYLGRIRGMITDGLLNKMFKELNMM